MFQAHPRKVGLEMLPREDRGRHREFQSHPRKGGLPSALGKPCSLCALGERVPHAGRIPDKLYGMLSGGHVTETGYVVMSEGCVPETPYAWLSHGYQQGVFQKHDYA